MDEKQFIIDLWDVIRGNTQYITVEGFQTKYKELIVEPFPDDGNSIRLMDDHNEWLLRLQKVWCDETQV